MNQTKVCVRCQIPKPLTEFHKNCATFDKHHTICKPCRCFYVLMTSDVDYKRAKSRYRYALIKCNEKAKRVAINLLKQVQLEMTDASVVGEMLPAKVLLKHFVPEGTITAISNLLQACLGPDVYWNNYGRDWMLKFKSHPPMPSWLNAADVAQYIRTLLAPHNIVFASLKVMPPDGGLS